MLYSFAGLTESKFGKHKKQIFFSSSGCLVGVLHILYTVKLSDKHQKLLNEMFWNDAYFILVPEDQYVINWHNNATHIYSVTMHVGMVDRQIFWP